MENVPVDIVDDDNKKILEKEKNVVAVENHEKQHNSTELYETPTSTSDELYLHSNNNNNNIKKNNTDDILKEMSSIAAKRLAESSSINSLTNNDISTTPIIEKKEKKGGLGGFLQRFSKLRFSGRNKVPKSEINKTDVVNIKTTKNYDYSNVKKEPNYIIIPLHGPVDDEKLKQQQNTFLKKPVDLERSASCLGKNGRPPVCSSKPPLPPQQQHQQHQNSLRGACAPSPSTRNNKTTGVTINSRRRATTDLGNPIAIEMAKARTMQHHQNHQTWCDQQEHQQHQQQQRPSGLLETDIDAEINNDHQRSTNNSSEKKTQSLLNLNHTSRHNHQDNTQDNINDNILRVPQSSSSSCRNSNDHCDHSGKINQRPHKSMEFLLDKENLHFVKPPENELQKVGERVPSEHELRVQRSLQRLNVPDWYKNSPSARDGGFRLKRHSDASQHGGWRSLGSKTTSLSSLSSSSNRQNSTGPLLSPSPTPPVFSRWSTSLLNSAGSSPANSARSSFNHRQPYLGWRSQERLANPRTPAERLAQGILPQLQTTKKNQQTSQQLEVRNSIKEVTSAIVHYVQSGHENSSVGGVDENDDGRLSPRPRTDEWDDRAGGKSMSPRGEH